MTICVCVGGGGVLTLGEAGFYWLFVCMFVLGVEFSFPSPLPPLSTAASFLEDIAIKNQTTICVLWKGRYRQASSCLLTSSYEA